jgi:hypothetical protein
MRLQDQKKQNVVLSLTRGFMVWLQTTFNDVLISNSFRLCHWRSARQPSVVTATRVASSVAVPNKTDSEVVEEGEAIEFVGESDKLEAKPELPKCRGSGKEVIPTTTSTLERLYVLVETSAPSTTTLTVRKVLAQYYDQRTADALVRTMQNVCRAERAVKRDSLMRGTHTGVSRQDEYLFFIVNSLRGLSRDFARLRRPYTPGGARFEE